MTHDEAFIRAIRETPTDDAPRLIYADWLEEHGRADRAEFIRIQCQIARLPEDAPIKQGLQSRVEDLLRRHWDEWVGPLRDIVGPWRDRYGEEWLQEQYHSDGLVKFQRGFVDYLSLTAESFLRHARQLQRLAPLRGLRLWGAGNCAAALAREPALSGLLGLGFTDYYDAPLKARDMVELAASPYLEGLTALFLGRNNLGDEGVESLAQAPWLVRVQILDLTDNGLSDRGVRALAESPYLVKLAMLNLRRNSLSRAGIEMLRDSRNLSRTIRLEYDPPLENALTEESPHP
ncbi:MAG: TIGR02996 domain-containing protein [Gemmataceae bacterium]